MIRAARAPSLGLRRFQAGFARRVRVLDLPDEAPVRRGHFLVLLLLLPFFGEVFQYLKPVLPLWALSKAFPILSFPLCLFLLRGDRLPRGSRQLLVSMLYLVLVPSFTGIFTYGQSFFLGLTSQVKLLPILYFFSFTGLLRLLRPSASEIAKPFLALALASFATLILLWLSVPHSSYTGSYSIGDAPLFTFDNRGYRIRMPYFFGIVGTFYCFRRFFAEGKLQWLLLTAAGFASVVGIIRARSTVLGLALVLAIGAIRFSKRFTRIVLLCALPFAAAALVSIPYVASAFSTSNESGFSIRRISLEKAIAFLGDDPLRWLFGVGSLSPLDPGGMMRFFNHTFFLADITWVGTIFEFGLIGALLILLLPARGLWESRHVQSTRAGAFLGSLQDYLLYSILISGLYPLTLQPGEFALILAILVHEQDRRAPDDPRFSPA